LTWILGEEATDTGYLGLAARSMRTNTKHPWKQTSVRYPDDLDYVNEFCRQHVRTHHLYFCPTLLSNEKRVKENVQTARVLWADLDECPPESLLVKPSVVIETSPQRYHAYWRLQGLEAALDVQRINKRIAYYHKEEGCDTSGWDLTQLLRIPGSNNQKGTDIHSVRMHTADNNAVYSLEDFDAYPALAAETFTPKPMPAQVKTGTAGTPAEAPITGPAILKSYESRLPPQAFTLFEKAPLAQRRSHNLWALQQLLFAAGLSEEEVFVVVKEAACNKFAHSDELTWKEVQRASAYFRGELLTTEEQLKHEERDLVLPMNDLLSDEELRDAANRRTLVEDYIDWAKSTGDAAPEYHEAAAFIILSTLMASSVKLPTSFGVIKPNLWIMITGTTTLSRKSTSMDLAVDLLQDVDSDYMLATDGSIEGLMTSLSTRPGRASLFHRDEFSGMLEQMSKRDYYAGMLEVLTKLYDGKMQKRLLRRETIEVRNPCFILFAGGIKDRILGLITPEHIDSGFIPRFCFVHAEPNLNKLAPLGPPSSAVVEGRDDILTRLRSIHTHYNNSSDTFQGNAQHFSSPQGDWQPTNPNPVISVNGGDGATATQTQVVPQGLVQFSKSWNAELTTDAWGRYNKIVHEMQLMGVESSRPDVMTAMMSRLGISGLKMAILIAASDKLGEQVLVQERDIVQAFYYITKWKQHTLDVVMNAGKSRAEKEIERIYQTICQNPGIMRASLMQMYHLRSREADGIFATLEQRGMVSMQKAGRGEKVFPVNPEAPIEMEKA
jgi:hypothetical protein